MGSSNTRSSGFSEVDTIHRIGINMRTPPAATARTPSHVSARMTGPRRLTMALFPEDAQLDERERDGGEQQEDRGRAGEPHLEVLEPGLVDEQRQDSTGAV